MGIGMLVHGFRLLQRRRLILDTPFSKIRSAAMGMVEVSGLAAGPYTMIAPVTGMQCFYYRTCIWEWKQQGKNKDWVKIASECMHVPFFIDDNTGKLLIDPRGADLDIHRDFQEEFNNSFFSSRDEAPANVNLFLSRHNIATTNKIKVEEYCIKPKNSLFILGTLTDNAGVEVTPNAIPETEGISQISAHGITLAWSTSRTSSDPIELGSFMQKLTAKAPRPKVIHLSVQADPAQREKITAALQKAGISNPAAWSAAGLGNPAIQVNQTQIHEHPSGKTTSGNPATADPNGFDPHPPVVLMRGSNDKTFLISWRSQQDVARSLGWKSMLMIWGGPAVALFSIYVLLSITNLL